MEAGDRRSVGGCGSLAAGARRSWHAGDGLGAELDVRFGEHVAQPLVHRLEDGDVVDDGKVVQLAEVCEHLTDHRVAGRGKGLGKGLGEGARDRGGGRR